jgi:hypothetical protein
MSNPVGRPPKFDSPEQLEQLSKSWWESIEGTEEIPDIETWAIALDTTRKTLFEYEDKPNFSNTIKRWKDRIFASKKQLALRGKLNPAIFIFDAINNTDYRNRTEQDLHVKELPKPILSGLAKNVSADNSDAETS